ncbi:MAG: RNA-binding S4 domain-containing protein [Corynebacterium sp.]|nr:RNA-binding S4 domain-containing protein [Corynebacterium sp.]
MNSNEEFVPPGTADVAIAGDSIKLGQFIKLASLVDTGGEAKEAIAQGAVTVNGEVDTRRGGTLHVGDIVCIGKQCARVTADSDDDFFDEATADDDFDPEYWRNL